MTGPDAGAGTRTTVGGAVRGLQRCFRAAGLETADLDARRLVAAALDVPAERLIIDADRPIADGFARRIEEYRRRRLDHEPVSRILACRAFFGRDFLVTPAVLDPRPETETLVEAALGIIDRLSAAAAAGRPLRILDIGVGSGAILLTLLAERRDTVGVGIDISDEAIAVAAENAGRLGVAARVRLERRAVAELGDVPFDVVVSNPPYIPAGDISSLARDVAAYDPRLALDGGADGLDVYRQIFGALSRAAARPVLILEIGVGQERDVVEMAHHVWLDRARCCIDVIEDLSGHARCVVLETHC